MNGQINYIIIYVECFIYKKNILRNADYELKPILYDIQKIYLTSCFQIKEK